MDQYDNMVHEYNYYTFGKEICWFEKMSPVVDSDTGNEYYLPDDQMKRRFSSGDLDLNLSTPYSTGDIVRIDCRPFAPPFFAIILEGCSQFDCCFPTILFKIPYTDSWRIASLKHKGFYKDVECSFYTPMLSPLYRIARVEDKDAEEQVELLEISKYFCGDEDLVENIWRAVESKEEMSKEELIEVLQRVCGN